MTEIKKAYEPYKKEALFCLKIDIVLVLLTSFIVVIIFITKNIFLLKSLIFDVAIVILIFMDYVFNYHLIVCTIMEYRNNKYSVVPVIIVDYDEEASFSGHDFHSVIPKLYDKELCFYRYKIITLQDDNKPLTLRLACGKKRIELIKHFKENKQKIYIKYGLSSKILISICEKSDEAYKFNKLYK